MNRCSRTAKLYRIRQTIVARAAKRRGPLFDDTDWMNAHDEADKLIASAISFKGIHHRPVNNRIRSTAKALGV